MRYKVFVTTLITVLIASMGLISCAPVEEEEEELLPCEVEFSGVSSVFGGEQAVGLDTSFVIKNPNNFGIIVEPVEYWLSVGDEILEARSCDVPVYISAGAEVQLTYTTIIELMSIISRKVMSEGMPGGAATVAALPVWKSMGGKLPAENTPISTIWAEAQAGPATYTVEGTASISSHIGETCVPFKFSFSSE